MYIDIENRLCNAQAFTADANSTNAFDNSAAAIDFGSGEEMCVGCAVTTAADFTTGNETYQFNFNQSTSDQGTSPDILVSMVILATTLVAGYLFALPIPPGVVTKRYLFLAYDGGGTTPTISLTAWITRRRMFEVQKRNYASGFTIS